MDIQTIFDSPPLLFITKFINHIDKLKSIHTLPLILIIVSISIPRLFAVCSPLHLWTIVCPSPNHGVVVSCELCTCNVWGSVLFWLQKGRHGVLKYGVQGNIYWPYSSVGYRLMRSMWGLEFKSLPLFRFPPTDRSDVDLHHTTANNVKLNRRRLVCWVFSPEHTITFPSVVGWMIFHSKWDPSKKL